MERYIALLRGVNISGKNKVAMPELKAYFMDMGYTDIRTHLNSGNVIFSVNERDELAIADRIKNMIQERFERDIPVFVISQEKLRIILEQAPSWWGTEDKEIYDNLIFVIPPATAEVIVAKIGEPTKEYEKISVCETSIFWSFDRKNYAKANWWKKTAKEGIGELLTIRNANTLRKIVGM